jgi:hypothetical protein
MQRMFLPECHKTGDMIPQRSSCNFAVSSPASTSMPRSDENKLAAWLEGW